MDAGDLIYILIVIGGLISGFIKKRNKKRGGTTSSIPRLDDLIKEFSQTEQPPATEPTSTKASHQPTYSTPSTEPANMPDSGLEYSKKSSREIIKEHKEKLNIIDSYDETEDSKQTIDLKQAIILDTIINRPNY